MICVFFFAVYDDDFRSEHKMCKGTSTEGNRMGVRYKFEGSDTNEIALVMKA